MTETTLLIDGDVIAFTAAAAVQCIHEDEHGFVQPFARRQEGEAVVDNMVIGLEVLFKSTHRRIALSDPKVNWRHEVYPAYKGHRMEEFAGQVRPLLLGILKQYLRDKYEAFHWPTLEADDTLGILATETQEYPGKRILVGRDKDFRTIPGTYHQMGRLGASKQPILEEITPWEAQRNHLFQTLAGDTTDGYGGCVGLGKARAAEVLDNPRLLVPQHGVITRGVNKGNSTTKWVAEPTRDLWACVTSNFHKAGQTTEDAITMARLANILHADQYNKETGDITLWTPDRIRQS